MSGPERLRCGLGDVEGSLICAGIRCAEADPLLKVVDGGIGELAGGRHLEAAVGVGDDLNEEALVGLAFDESGPGIAALAEGGAGIETEAAEGSFEFGAMAGVAFGGEDGADFRFEEIVVRLGGEERHGGEGNERRESEHVVSILCFSGERWGAGKAQKQMKASPWRSPPIERWTADVVLTVGRSLVQFSGSLWTVGSCSIGCGLLLGFDFEFFCFLSEI